MFLLSKVFLAFWLFFPGLIANATPIPIAKIHALKKYNFPVDFGKEFRGKRLLGKGKTFRGLFFGITAGVLVAFIESWLAGYYRFTFLPEFYYDLNPFIYGFFISVGALGGDIVKSFAKRRLDIESGGPWFPFDQLDYVFGMMLVSLLFFRLDFITYLVFLVVGVGLHLISNLFAFALGIKDVPY